MPRSTEEKQNQNELRMAERLFIEQRYAELAKHLAPQIFLHRSNPCYYFLLGVASLYVGDFAGAHSYLLRGKDLDPLDLDLQLALAITYLHRKDDPQALRLLVDIQDKHPTNAKVILALEMLKQAPEKVDWPELLKLGQLRQLYPGPGFDWRRLFRRIGLGLGAAAAIAVVALLVSLLVQFIITRQALARVATVPTASPSAAIGQPLASAVASPGAGAVDDRRFGVVPGQAPRFPLSVAETAALMGEVTRAFREYRDNTARVLVNRLMQSDAGVQVKEQMRGLAAHFREPGFANFRDNFDPAAVAADPLLHCGTYVMWRGKIADVQKGQTAILFKLLVGYESSPVVVATVPVRLEFAAEINAGEAIELIGQVEPDFTAGGFGLRGSALRLIRSN